jgi:hypothetical protein
MSRVGNPIAFTPRLVDEGGIGQLRVLPTVTMSGWMKSMVLTLWMIKNEQSRYDNDCEGKNQQSQNLSFISLA